VTALLQASAAEYTYRAQRHPAVDGVSITIQASEAVGIVGESGSGKSTLGRLLVGVLNPTAGAVTVHGRPWSMIDRRNSCRRRVQMVFQDPYAALNPWRSPIESVAEVIGVWDRVGGREALRRAELLLAEVGLGEEALRQRPRTLSGGQCQRIGIARALAAAPEVLIADEPTSSLDMSVQAQILNLLGELRRRRGLALVLISHDLSVVRYATDRALVMYGGQIVEEGPTDELLDSPAHPYTRVLVDAIPGHEGLADTVANEISSRGGCVFAAKCAHLQGACVSERPMLRGRSARRVACVRVEEPDAAMPMERG
jgi:peptide/nickel transport system ATP-binding protein